MVTRYGLADGQRPGAADFPRDVYQIVSHNHRPHLRQVTGARCTESWAEYSSRPTTDSRQQGWVIKDFFVLSEMLTICEQPLYGIVLMILHINKPCVLSRDQNSQICFKSIQNIHNASGHSRSLLTSCRTRPSWHNGSSLGPHVLNGYGSMTLAPMNTVYGTGDPALVDMWRTSHQNIKYQSSLRRRNHWRKSKGCASVPKNGFPHWCDWILCQC